MPKYANSTAADIAVGSFRFPARSSMDIDVFLEGTLPAGLTLVSVPPQKNTSLLENKYSAITGADVATITVPESDSKGYHIKIYVESGEFEVRFNEAAMTPPFRITEGQTFDKKYISRVVNDIRLHCVIGGQVFVNIEEN